MHHGNVFAVYIVMHLKTSTQCTQWSSQAGAHWGMCPSNLRLCSTSGYKLSAPEVLLSIANQVLKIHEVLQIEQLSIAICILRLTKSRMLLWSHCLLRVVKWMYTAHTFVWRHAQSAPDSMQLYWLIIYVCDWVQKFQNFLGSMFTGTPSPPPLLLCFIKKFSQT